MATDADSDKYSQFKLTLHPVSEYFRLDENTGHLFTIGALDRERVAVHHLLVRAQSYGDQDARDYRTEAEVEVTVTDVNDNPPIFRRANGTVRLSVPCEEGVLVATVKADDPDTDDTLSYGVVSGNEGSYFRLDPETGELRTSRPFHVTSTPRVYQLALSAEDGDHEAGRLLRVEVGERVIINDMGDNFVIVVAIGAISGVLIVILSIAIAVVCRQRGQSDKDVKRPIVITSATATLRANDLDDLTMALPEVMTELQRRNSLTSVRSNTSSLQLTNSFTKVDSKLNEWI